jgi:hypothetical protein
LIQSFGELGERLLAAALVAWQPVNQKPVAWHPLPQIRVAFARDALLGPEIAETIITVTVGAAGEHHPIGKIA